MKISELQVGTISTFELEPAESPTFARDLPHGTACQVLRSISTNELLLSLEKVGIPGEIAQTWKVKPVSKDSELRIEEVVGREMPRVCYVLSSTPKGKQPKRVTLKIHEFAGQHALPGRLEAGIDDKIQRELRQSFVQGNPGAAELDRFLRDQVLLPPGRAGGPPRAILCASPARDLIREKALRVLGQELTLDLVRDDADKLVVRRVTQARKPSARDSRALQLVEVDLCFPDSSVTGVYAGVTRTTLEQLVQKNESYLALWKEYNALEKRTILRQARDFGWLRYSSCKQASTGAWRFELEARSETGTPPTKLLERVMRVREDGLSLEATADLPPTLLQPPGAGIKGESSEARQTRESGEDDALFAELQADEDHFIGSYEAHRVRGQVVHLELAPSDPDNSFEPPSKGFLHVSIRGDAVRLRRREAAEAAIRTAQNPMPQLGLLLENQPTPLTRFPKLKAMSQAARARFRGDPTPAQGRALELAMNTPDIVVIQGPPGTGKTQVIAALEVLLADAGQHTEQLSGSILLSSFQHEAVENAAQRTEVLGLPAVKVGQRSGQEKNIDPAKTWRLAQIERLREVLVQRPDRPFEVLRRDVARLALLYHQNPGELHQVASLLRSLTARLQSHVPQKLLDGMIEVRLRLERVQAPGGKRTPEQALLLKAVSSLRVTETAFRDDGPRNALKLLKRLESSPLLTPDARALLERAGAWEDGDVLDFLPELAQLQATLQDHLRPMELPPTRPVADPDIEQLFARLIDALSQRERTSRDGIDLALWTYLEDLEHDPREATRALQEYTAVLAATCQQSVGRAMSSAKDLDQQDAKLAFETVIVDEAARANPLDLFIPMARATRRIVLVGDQRQLPHMLEPDLERELATSASEQILKALKLSLFQRLFEMLEAREKADGICRTVMLDTQFRMHPMLGEFISKHFYAGRLKSGRPEMDFRHSLPGYASVDARASRLHVHTSGCMAWLEVPLSSGHEQSGRSKSRKVEARAIARELARLLHFCDQSADPTQRELTFGVITFYAAQVETLWEAFCDEKLARHTDGRYQLNREYQFLTDGRERLRVGTVDAFQGKEFDVVFLSLARANAQPEATELERRRRFGHLMLTNRVNVAMSRQQRLLVVAGATEMVQSPAAAEAIPALKDFHRLCLSP